MKEQIRIKVERLTSMTKQPIVKLFERSVEIDSSVQVPYNTIVEVLRFMYPDSIVSVSSSLI